MFRSHIYLVHIYTNWIWHKITENSLYAIKTNQTKSSDTSKIWYKVNFYVDYIWFEFRLFLLLDSHQPKIKESVCPTIYPYLRRRIVEFIPFPRILALWEMQNTSYRIWTQVTKSISNNNNHYTMRSSSNVGIWILYYNISHITTLYSEATIFSS